MKIFYTIAFILCVCFNGLMVRAQQIYIHKYDIEDGLVNNDILNIYTDSRGFIWLCTRGGLSRFDGSRFTNFTTRNGLTNDMINDIVEIAPQQFIIAQNMDGPKLLKDDRISSLKSNTKIVLNRFYKMNGRLLATTDLHGIAEWTNNDFKALNPAYKENVDKLTRLSDSVWLIHLPFYSQLTNSFLKAQSPLTPPQITTAFTDSRKRTWIGTIHGLRLFDPAFRPGKPISYLPLPPPFHMSMLKEVAISDLIEDSRGNFWIGTFKGLVKIDKHGNAKIYSHKDGLPAGGINCIKEDEQNNIWIGTSHGLAKLSTNNEINSYALNDEFTQSVSIAVSPLTESTIRLFNGEEILELNLHTGNLTYASTTGNASAKFYKPDNESLLVIKGRKAHLYHPWKKDHETIDWPDTAFACIARTGGHHFIATESNRFFTVSNAGFTEKLTLDINSWIYKLVVDKSKTVWAGTWQDGLVKLRFEGGHDSLTLKVVDTLVQRLPDRHIRALYTDRPDELWIGTRYKGLVRLLERQDGTYELQKYGTSEGLTSDFVLTIKRDKAGNIWVGTPQGLDKLIPEGNGYRVFNFGQVNKVFSKIQDIFFMDNNSLIAIGHPLLVHAVDMRQDTLLPPRVYLTKVVAAGGDSSLRNLSGPIRLPDNRAQIYFEFSAPQFINEDFTKYSYRLMGTPDTGWNIAGKSRTVSFASLRPGNYTFEVRALGFNGKWGDPARYSFIVNSPFWQKAWFIGLMIAIFGLLVYALYRYRMQQVIRVQKVRNRIASDLHDEIGSSLTNISILTNLGRTHLANPQNAGGFLQRISEEVSSSSQALDDIIWSVNTSHDTLEETVARMRRYAAELFDAAGISYELHLDPEFEKIKLGMEQRRDIYLLYKETVNNISKHAQAKNVSIQITIKDNLLLMQIRDDGKGFELNMGSDRHGLTGMRNRVQKWKGVMQVESGSNKGVSVYIRIPLSN